MSQLFTGAGVALITPFNEDLSIDFDALGQIVENQILADMDYIVALGTTAETATLTEIEKIEVVRYIVKKIDGRLPLVVGMGGNNTQAVIDNIKNFNLNGVDGLLIVTPYYNKPEQEGLYRHFKAISDISPLPVILYNVPSRTGVNMEAETVIRLANDFNNIVAIKEASGMLSQVSKIKKYSSDDFTVISGDDAMALPIISIGGKGVISVIANAIPHKTSSLIHMALEKDYTGSEKIHNELIELLKLIFCEGNPSGIKALLHHHGIIKNILRLPLISVSDKLNKQIKETANIL